LVSLKTLYFPMSYVSVAAEWALGLPSNGRFETRRSAQKPFISGLKMAHCSTTPVCCGNQQSATYI
jgi:hypothetical protein